MSTISNHQLCSWANIVPSTANEKAFATVIYTIGGPTVMDLRSQRLFVGEILLTRFNSVMLR
jgi:hypothetical protein